MLEVEINCGMGTAESQRRLLAEAGWCVTVSPVPPSGCSLSRAESRCQSWVPGAGMVRVVLKGCSSWGNSCFPAAWILCSVPKTHTQPQAAISNGSWLSHVCQEGEPQVTAASAVVNSG